MKKEARFPPHILHREPTKSKKGRDTDDGYKDLAAAIIECAVKDWKKYRRWGSSNRHIRELNLFFASDWFEMLSDIVGISPDVIREKLEM